MTAGERSRADDRYSVVIVDDVPEIRQVLGLILEDSGWFAVVGEAGSAADAVDVVGRRPPDVVLLDVELPDRRSWEIVPDLRRSAPDTRIVVLTGSVGADERIREGAAVDAVIDKGSPARVVVTRLLDVLGSTSGRVPEAEATSSGGSEATTVTDVPADLGAWFEAVLAVSTDAVIGIDDDGRVMVWNAAATSLLGRRAAEMLGRPVDLLIPGDRTDALQAVCGAARQRGRASSDAVLVDATGHRLDVTIHAAAVNGQRATCLVVRDLSSRRQTDEALARAINQLERRNRELRRSNDDLDSFAAVASHDLAQPLQVAVGFLDMLRTDHGASLDPPADRWLDHSIDSLERMRLLVRDILRWSRAGAGEPARRPVDLDAVVADIVAVVGDAVRERGGSIEVTRLPSVIGDQQQLALVFQNLLTNAIKFVPDDRPPVLRIEGREVGDEVEVVVTDNGIGVPEAQRGKVFEMFGRSTLSGDYDGTGLGLAIVKKIVGRHRGSVWIEEAPRGGTAVHLRLLATEAATAFGRPSTGL